MTEVLDNSISTKELCKEYEWYKDTFSQVVQSSCDEFFGEIFDLNLFGVSQNINYLINNEPCFVSKARINNDYEVFFRLTDKAVELILDKSLGAANHKFNLKKISELEAEIITSFNGALFKAVKQCLNEPDPKELKRKNYDNINLTFLITGKDKLSRMSGKIIVTLPKSLLAPQEITSSGNTFSEDDFSTSETFVKIIVGKTKFSLYNLKNLETEDIVVLDNSNIEKMTLSFQGTQKTFNINPNMDLLIPEQTNEGDNNMPESQNIWDNIEVEINAEFDTVKVSLGELKSIESGQVVDLASLYDNNVTLKVEGHPIASGSLVIVNDRYGVKINEVIPQNGEPVPAAAAGQPSEQTPQEENQEYDKDENYGEEVEDNSEDDNEDSGTEGSEESGDEFDYSDFELDDDNI